MSRYTVQLRWIIETQKSNIPGSLYDKVLASAADNSIFERNYPLFDETHRTELNTKIINHYLFREIGLETVSLWKKRLAEKMDLIMPKYNLMFKALSHEFNIFQNINTVKEYTAKEIASDKRDQTQSTSNDRTRTGMYKDTTENTGNVNTSGSSTAENSIQNTSNNNQNTKHSDYPQSNISTGDYLSEEEQITGSTSQNTHDLTTSSNSQKTDTSNTGELNHTENYTDNDTGSLSRNETGNSNKDNNSTENISGLNGYPVDALVKYLENIYNVDEMIVNELSDLFFLLY